jgi:hypothetical protein
MCGFDLLPQRVQDDARFDAGGPPERIDLENAVHELGKVQYDGNIAALSGEARAGASWQHGSAMPSAHGNRGFDIVSVSGDDQAHRNLAVVRGVAGIDRASAAVESDLAANRPLQVLFELEGLRKSV